MSKISSLLYGLFFGLLVCTTSCERDLDELELATGPANPDVFIDGFSGGLIYAAFGGSDVRAFDVDNDITFAGTASMRFAVPDFESPAGAFAGGTYFLEAGRDLSDFNVLSFWARASQPANLDVVGFGNDLGANENIVAVNGLALNTNWQQYFIPIPDPARLTDERGMFYYSEGPENERGYTLWIDEVKFENLGTIVPGPARIFGGEDRTVTAENGATFTIDGEAVFSLPNGVNQTMSVAPAYFSFVSSDPSVATVDANGQVRIVREGAAVITATLAGEPVTGSLIVRAVGEVQQPRTAAPTPTEPADEVISIYSNAYDNAPLDFLNGFWEFSTTQSEELQIDGNDLVRYSQLNFVGIQFTSPTIDARAADRFHIDIWTPDATAAPATFKILLFDLGPDNSFGGGDDASHEVTITAPTLQSETWVSIDLPLSDFPGLTTRANLAQVVLSGDLPNLFVDNIYLYDSGGSPGGGSGGGTGGQETAPTVAAPAPTTPAANVISLFSDAYPDVNVDTYRTDWSMGTLEALTVAGNATHRYSNVDFVGIETINNQVDATSMTHFRLDVWSPDATAFGVKLVDFGADGVFGGGDDVEHQIDFPAPPQRQWVSYDIPLSDFVDLTTRANIAQYILVGRPAGSSTLFVDNMYFRR